MQPFYIASRLHAVKSGGPASYDRQPKEAIQIKLYLKADSFYSAIEDHMDRNKKERIR